MSTTAKSKTLLRKIGTAGKAKQVRLLAAVPIDAKRRPARKIKGKGRDKMSTILIIEDNTEINNLIRETMEKSGYSCVQAFSGTEALYLLPSCKADLIIMDLMLPGKCGEELLPQIKKMTDASVLVVSAKDAIDTKVSLLKNGAEDYLTKPFNLKELAVRVEVLLRRSRPTATAPALGVGEVLTYKELVLNREDFTVTVLGKPVELTAHEFRILELFLKNPTRAFTKQAIYDYAWDDSYLGEDKTINVHISNLRKKLKTVSDTEYIETVWGIGFKLKK